MCSLQVRDGVVAGSSKGLVEHGNSAAVNMAVTGGGVGVVPRKCRRVRHGQERHFSWNWVSVGLQRGYARLCAGPVPQGCPNLPTRRPKNHVREGSRRRAGCAVGRVLKK
jgi:hypothetical protein